MPRKSAARRTLSKGDDATIPVPPDNDLDEQGVSANASKGDDDKKPWETDSASKADDDEDDDKKPWEKNFASKSDDDDDDDKDDEDDDTSKADDDEDETGKTVGKSARFRRDLQKAIGLLSRHGELHDPDMRKEALMAKELRGGGMSKSERSELVELLAGRSDVGSTRRVVQHQAPGAALRKSMVANDAFAEAYDNLTKSVTAQAQHLDGVCKSMERTNHLMARVLTKSADTLGAVFDRQEALAEAIDSLARQPAHAPRSVGINWAEKSFGGGTTEGIAGAKGGRLEKSSPARVMKALDEMSKSVGANTEAGQAYRLAKDSLLLRRPLTPSVAARVEEHLSANVG